jgi:hypothetical protein
MQTTDLTYIIYTMHTYYKPYIQNTDLTYLIHITYYTYRIHNTAYRPYMEGPTERLPACI